MIRSNMECRRHCSEAEVLESYPYPYPFPIQTVGYGDGNGSGDGTKKKGPEGPFVVE